MGIWRPISVKFLPLQCNSQRYLTLTQISPQVTLLLSLRLFLSFPFLVSTHCLHIPSPFSFRGFVATPPTFNSLGSPFNCFRLASNATTLKGFFGCVGHRVGYLAFFLKRRTFTQGLLAVTHPTIMSSSDDDMPLARGNKSNGLSNGTNGMFLLSSF